MKKTIYNLPISSTAFLKSPEFYKLIGRDCALVCEYENEKTASDTTLTLVFENSEAFKVTYYKACDLEIVQNAYDKVIDCGNTKWLEEIQINLIKNGSQIVDLAHLAIYFDDGPAYEFICKGFRLEESEFSH